jgi:hypothetical protein
MSKQLQKKKDDGVSVKIIDADEVQKVAEKKKRMRDIMDFIKEE